MGGIKLQEEPAPAFPASAFRAEGGAVLLTPGLQLTLLVVIGLAYIVLAIGWTRATPAWDNPDEPAHWNFVRHVAQTGALPILRPGDYPQAQVESLKSARFPPGSNIDGIQYESHQPPLYYAGAAVVYKLTTWLPLKRQVDALRLLSTIFGVLTIVASWRIVRSLLPGEPYLALATASFIAFVPMHVNMSAAVDNDALGDLLLTVAVLGMLLWLQRGFSVRGAVILGIVIGLAALTKVTTLAAFPLALLAAALRYWRVGRDQRHVHPFVGLLISYAAALAVWGWWVLRNVLTYGLGDPLALKVNKLVVTQLQTGALNAAAIQRFAKGTFDSFWAQFGWMGIPVPQVYAELKLLTILAGIGLAVALLRALRLDVPGAAVRQKAGEVVLVLAWPVLVILEDLQYNLTFVQTQGRYLFPAIGGIGLFFMLGLSRLAGPRLSPVVLTAASVLLAALCAVLLKTVVIPAWR